MADDERTSFDPKTWLIAPGEAGAPPPLVAVSQPQARTMPPRATVLPPRPVAAAAGKPPYALAAMLSVLLLTGGAAAAYLTRSASPAAVPMAAQPGAPSVVAPPPPEVIDASRRTLVVAGPGDVAATLAGTGIAADAAAAATRAAQAAIGPDPGEIRMVIDLTGPDGARRMTRLEATRTDGSGAILTVRPDGSYGSEVQQARLTTEVQVVRGEMDATSFYNAAVTAGITDSLIEPFAKALSFDFNFATDVHPGDVFEAAFEQKVNPQGEQVGSPTLIYVSIQTEAKSKALYRFLAPGETEAGWFDGNGHSTQTALMRTPVDGARITSGFGMRFHPVLHYTRLHGGVDFAAPIGTPIYAAAAGVVTSSSPTACAGNMLILHHDNGWETRYFHLSRYADGIHPGVRVTQGETVGAIGTTGFCTTGPHLHFEVHINGEKVDPMTVDYGTGKALSGDGLAAFRRERDRIDRARAAPTTS
ncbi:peptidoglycan DD-metalloendopeptidase family protein [Sphingomonas sp.]|uniref:peptidoglycan DD-metalloendopeptidase family protein n=1 Tax=Sphingomonas sp. TaxID=28214 RepID=UPI003CC50397